MKPVHFNSKQYIYREEDDVENIYFLIKGTAGFVLPLYDNAKYVNINVGDHFGVIDIIGCQPKDLDISLVDWIIHSWINYKSRLRRQFTVMASHAVEVLTVSIPDL
jgi:CRP-like cAMP-binding protein